MWISGGDHDLTDNIVHLVLAKVPDERGVLRPGVAGISLFAVPKYLPGADNQLGERNDVVVAGLNHKMGYRGTSNCLLNFGEGRYRPGGRAGAVGELIGEEGRGLAYMFHMMNEARITVGLGAAAIGYTGYLHSVDYARRSASGPVADTTKSGIAARAPHRSRRRSQNASRRRLLSKGRSRSCCSRRCSSTRPSTAPAEDAERARKLLDLLTPVSKSWPSKWGVAANDLAIQVHGGYGYTQDFNVEQFYRDNRLNPIHEGTFGIQAIDLLGRKVGAADGAGAGRPHTAESTRSAERAAAIPELAEEAAALRDAWSRVLETTTSLRAITDATLRLANASCYLDAFGHVVVAWLWLDQAVIAARGIDGSDERVLSRQTGCLPLLLQVGTAAHRSVARTARFADRTRSMRPTSALADPKEKKNDGSACSIRLGRTSPDVADEQRHARSNRKYRRLINDRTGRRASRRTTRRFQADSEALRARQQRAQLNRQFRIDRPGAGGQQARAIAAPRRPPAESTAHMNWSARAPSR